MKPQSKATRRPGTWSNWSGNQTAAPERIAEPRDLDALKVLVKAGTAPVRVAGAGHSFTPVAITEGTLLKLGHLGLVHSVDTETKRAWVNAGARLRDLSPALETHGLAFRNLGDINAQTLAGAISTATHGTGASLPCLSAEITGLKIMQADGEMLTVSREADADVFDAARVSLGTLGVLVEAEVQLVDAYRLHRTTWAEPLDSLIGHAPSRWQTRRNYEFFYIPFAGYGICISHEETGKPETERPPRDDDEAVLGLKRARDYAGDDIKGRKAFLKSAFENFQGEDVVGNSWELLASQRNIRFNEMEYHLPEKRALSVFEEVVRTIEKKRPDVFFPIEVRRTRGDNIWLSPFNGGGRISIAVHAYHEDDYSFFFSEIEPIFRKAGGRPHWGKLHSLKAAQLSDVYPDFVTFCNVRNRLDPKGRFLTPYLRALFGANGA
ncbi:D-arabinono-1,4-lactone oxidase [Henriciella aquimarina]|uniref:D-arabinono-1,4-lactone oxidase n=1 Tax=Henriciella aquimarina TaxID=545261 RepID=UPI001F47FB6F|nr:D-arabinono-1,4-lactone oxidase [Henriciella aquimarina]